MFCRRHSWKLFSLQARKGILSWSYAIYAINNFFPWEGWNTQKTQDLNHLPSLPSKARASPQRSPSVAHEIFEVYLLQDCPHSKEIFKCSDNSYSIVFGDFKWSPKFRIVDSFSNYWFQISPWPKYCFCSRQHLQVSSLANSDHCRNTTSV